MLPILMSCKILFIQRSFATQVVMEEVLDHLVLGPIEDC